MLCEVFAETAQDAKAVFNLRWAHIQFCWKSFAPADMPLSRKSSLCTDVISRVLHVVLYVIIKHMSWGTAFPTRSALSDMCLHYLHIPLVE